MLYTVQGAYDIVVSKIKKSLLSWNLNGIKTINRYFIRMYIHTHILSGNISDFLKSRIRGMERSSILNLLRKNIHG